jgi:hypothetical protein
MPIGLDIGGDENAATIIDESIAKHRMAAIANFLFIPFSLLSIVWLT